MTRGKKTGRNTEKLTIGCTIRIKRINRNTTASDKSENKNPGPGVILIFDRKRRVEFDQKNCIFSEKYFWDQ